jgi:hypothetical protein
MAQDNRNKATQGQNQSNRQDTPQDENLRRGRTADDRDSQPARGGSAGKRDPEDVEDVDETDDMDEVDEDRDDDMRAEGGANRRKNIS